MKTTKQIADTLGIDKQRVYRYIKKNNIKESLQESGKLYYDENIEKLIIEGLTDNIKLNESVQVDTVDTLLKEIREREKITYDLMAYNKYLKNQLNCNRKFYNSNKLLFIAFVLLLAMIRLLNIHITITYNNKYPTNTCD